jgi:hypothetical protein
MMESTATGRQYYSHNSKRSQAPASIDDGVNSHRYIVLQTQQQQESGTSIRGYSIDDGVNSHR